MVITTVFASIALNAQILYECRSRNEDTVVYILGTIHRLPKDVNVDTALLAKLMGASEVIFSELYIDDGDTSYKRVSAEMSERQRFKNNGVLSDSLTKTEYQKLFAYYRQNYGVTKKQFRNASYYQPWVMHRKLISDDKFYCQFDNLVYGIAQRTSDKVVNLENEQALFNAFELLNTRYDVKWMLRLISHTNAREVSEDEQIEKYYLSQDTAAIMQVRTNGQYLAMQSVLISDRNNYWQQVIDQKMGKRNFIYCGLSHVISGDLSLLKYFTKKQYSVKAVEFKMQRLP